MSDVVGGRLTLATGTGNTVTVTVPFFPSLVAVIVAVPAATPVTTPVDDTEAIVASLDDHAIPRPESELPFASLGVAVRDTVCPAVTLAGDGSIVTDATGIATTVSGAVPTFPSTVALMTTVPGATALTTPLPDTVAIVVLELDHAMGRPAS